jgi:pimeloyl-ACP methyl ester carboxylesterase
VPHVELNGTRFHYRQAGRGPDVVLIHAVTSNLAVWVFIDLIDTLAADFRVTAYDLRGHGLSEATEAGYTSADMAEDFRRLHAALGLGPAYLVGHSFGAVVATHAAAEYPELVRGLVLSDPYFPGLAHVEPNLGQANVWLDLKEVFGHCGKDLGGDVDFQTLFRIVAELTPGQMKQIQEAMGAGAVRWLAQLPKLAETTCGRDVFAPAGLTAERICAVKQPAVALYDEHTPFAATRRYLEAHWPSCKVDTMPGAKHIAPLQNAPAFVALVQKHLRAMAGIG